MSILADISAALPEGNILDIQVNENWTAVIAEVAGTRRCGLASNPFPMPADKSSFVYPYVHNTPGLSVRALTHLAAQHENPAASIGMAAINALLPAPKNYLEENASELLARLMPERSTVLVGHFSFVEELKKINEKLVVLELLPREGDLPAEMAPQILPDAEVVAITSMTLINGTLEGLLKYCSTEAIILIIGPSTPFSPVLFDYGIDALCGTLVQDIDVVIEGITAGKKIRHFKPNGVRKAISFSEEFKARSFELFPSP